MADSYRLEDYDYHLPPERIAQVPCAGRSGSRLLVLARNHPHRREHRRFVDLADYLRRGDLLVLNDTRVVPSRLRGRKETGGRIELLVLDPYKPDAEGRSQGYECLVKASKPPRPGSRLEIEERFSAEVATAMDKGRCRVRFHGATPLLDLLQAAGRVPLPPYINRDGSDNGKVDDATCYQTVYAQHPGAVAAPTAGLHFTESMLSEIEQRGVEMARITLHVGYGTFEPIRTDDIRDHRMHAEFVRVEAAAARRIEHARRDGRRIVAVGTTVVRTLEWVASRQGRIEPYCGPCDHYIYPGYRFRVVGAMVTNFHLPRSSLILLVSAFAGRQLILECYREAVAAGYRFFSYGDAMLIL